MYPPVYIRYMRFFRTLSLLILLVLGSCQKKMEATLLITNGIVYDGISDEPKRVDIATLGDKIVYVGSAGEVSIKALKTIDASGMIVSPGFIDPHTHADRDLIKQESSANTPFLMQGVTTVVVGNDGSSFFPSSEYKKRYAMGVGTNVVMLVGHGTIRKEVIGESDRAPSEAELQKMKLLIQQEMEQGAFGMSTGLYYSPGSFANTREVVELARVVARNDGIYDTHLRDESSFNIGLIKAVEEAIEIGEQSGVPIHISHIKCLGKDVWGKSQEVIELIEAARNRGVEVTANQYPYNASGTSLKAAVVPRWAESGGLDSLFIRLEDPQLRSRILEETVVNIERRGGADKLLIVKLPDSTYVGKHLGEIAKQWKLPAEEAVFDLLRIGHAKVVSFNMLDSDVLNFMRQQWVLTGSDGNTGHPRKYGTFPRVYDRYVKREKVLSLSDFIHRSTSKTAQIFGIPKRGMIKEGYFADIIIFDPHTFKDVADYTRAFEFASGLQYSIINGFIAVEEGRYTQRLHGRVLRKSDK